MKFNIKFSKNNTRFIRLTTIGGCISIVSCLIYILNPLNLIVDKLLTMEPGSFLFKLWRDPPLEMIAKFYIFNVTNSEEFLAGREKLNFSEIGPFAYQEVLKNNHVTFNENGTLTYKPTRELIFREEYSTGDPNTTIIITPNVPLLGISSYIRNEYGSLMNHGFAFLAKMVETPPMKNLTIGEYLFGYEDPLITLASNYIPSWIDFTKFGIIDRLMSLDNGNNTVTIHLVNNKTTIDDPLPYSINMFNGSPGLKQWGYKNDSKSTICNTIEGSYDAGLFSRNIKENTTIRLYRRSFCRSFGMKHEATNYTPNGLKYYDYRIDQNFLSTSEENPENRCFCVESKECAPKGFGELSPCFYGVPIFMSQPHYLNADPEIVGQINGMKPNKEEHDTIMRLSPDFGLPLSAKLRVQINLKVAHSQIVTDAKPFEGLMIPLCWVELGLNEVPPLINTFLNIAIAMPIIHTVLVAIFAVLGFLLVSIGTYHFCFSSDEKEEKLYDGGGECKPILVLPVETYVISTEITRLR